jgi:hypothetical protein
MKYYQKPNYQFNKYKLTVKYLRAKYLSLSALRILGFMKYILVLHILHNTSFTLLSLLLCTYQCTPAGTVNTTEYTE